jgi:hypothetical protein
MPPERDGPNDAEKSPAQHENLLAPSANPCIGSSKRNSPTLRRPSKTGDSRFESWLPRPLR